MVEIAGKNFVFVPCCGCAPFSEGRRLLAMHQAPAFDRIAARILEPLVLALDRQGAELPPGQRYGDVKQSISEQLRLVWNARGAADRLALADLLLMQPANICDPIQYTIRSLDVESRASVREPT